MKLHFVLFQSVVCNHHWWFCGRNRRFNSLVLYGRKRYSIVDRKPILHIMTFDLLISKSIGVIF